jgi:ankyrin repeat protein
MNIDQILPNRLLEDIDRHLKDLEINVADHSIWLQTAYKYPDPWEYIATKTKWIDGLAGPWVCYKMDHSNEQRIPEYEEKLKTCQVYLDVMTETLLESKMVIPQSFEDKEIQQALAQSLNDLDMSSNHLQNAPQEIDVPKIVFPTDEREIKKYIFDSIKNNQLEECEVLLETLEASQKTQILASTSKFETSWAQGNEDMNPLQYSCFSKNLEAVKMLVKHGAQVNDFANTADSTQRASIHFAIDANQSDIALYLIAQGARDRVASCETFHAYRFYKLPAEYGVNWTCLSAFHMAIIKDMPEVVEALFGTCGVNLREKASGNNTALHLAMRKGNEKIFEILKYSKEFGDLLTIKNSDAKLPQDIAKENGHQL